MGKILVLKKSVMAVAMLAAAGMAAASTYTVTVAQDTPTALDVFWNWDYNSATAFTSTLASPDLQFWTATTSGVFDGKVLQVAVSAQHTVEPHPFVDVAPAPVYFAGLAGPVGDTGITSAMAPHLPTGVFVLPADFVTPHWDHYQFILSSDASGAQLELKAIHPVPEPATYAMLLGGLAMLGVAARRRGH